MKQYDAIIIGAGMGGLAAGVLMAHAGKRVAIVEKNKLNGGRLTKALILQYAKLPKWVLTSYPSGVYYNYP